MRKTYTQTVRYRFVIEGEYSCCNMWEEDVIESEENIDDYVLDYIGENINDFLISDNLKIIDLTTIEEN